MTPACQNDIWDVKHEMKHEDDDDLWGCVKPEVPLKEEDCGEHWIPVKSEIKMDTQPDMKDEIKDEAMLGVMGEFKSEFKAEPKVSLKASQLSSSKT